LLPKISVIIPVYNSKLYIKRAIESILCQTVQEFEIVIVDDGSTDNSISEINKIKDERIKIYQIKHGGVSIARNTGANLAQSDFIAFLDSDDEWTNIFIETVLKLKEKYPQAGIFATTSFLIKRDNQKLNENVLIFKDVLFEKNYFSYYLKNSEVIHIHGIALFKKIFNEMNGFNEKSAWGEDEDFIFRIALKYPIAYSYTICVIGYLSVNWREKTSKRVLITKEHPFIKNGRKAINEDNIPKQMINDLINLISRLQIFSARHNIIAGNFEYARKILNDIDNRYYKLRKFYLYFWVDLSNLIGKKGCKTLFYLHYSLLIKISRFLEQYLHVKIKAYI